MPSAKCHVIGKGRQPLARVCFMKPHPDAASLLPSAFAERLVKSLPRQFAASSALLTHSSMLAIFVDMSGRRHRIPADRFALPERAILRKPEPFLVLCHRIIPSPTTLIAVFPRTARKNGAVRGSSLPGTGRINLFINARARWKSDLPVTLCHEYYHSVEKSRRTKRKPWWYADMVTEGLAEHFAIAMSGARIRNSSLISEHFTVAEAKRALTILWAAQRANRKTIPDLRLYEHVVMKGPHHLGAYLVGAFIKVRQIEWDEAMHLKTDDVWKDGLAALGIKTGRR